MICLVLLIQILVYREISVLFRSTNDPWSNTLNWYFFAVANYFLYGETIIYYFKVGQNLLLLIPCPTSPGSMSSSRTLSSCHLQRTTDSSALCSTRLVCNRGWDYLSRLTYPQASWGSSPPSRKTIFGVSSRFSGGCI